MSQNEITRTVRELRELRRMAAELDQQIEALQDQIKAHMTSAETDELYGSDWKVTWKPVASQRFDKAAMVAAFGQSCYDGFCKSTTTRRFVVA